MVKPNFLVDKGNIKHKPSIFTKKILWVNAGRCLESLALIRWIVLFKLYKYVEVPYPCSVYLLVVYLLVCVLTIHVNLGVQFICGLTVS